MMQTHYDTAHGSALAPGDVIGESRYLVTKRTQAPTDAVTMLFCPKGFVGTLVASACDCCAWIKFDRDLRVVGVCDGRRLDAPVQISRRNVRRLSLLEVIAEAANG